MEPEEQKGCSAVMVFPYLMYSGRMTDKSSTSNLSNGVLFHSQASTQYRAPDAMCAHASWVLWVLI